MEGAPVGAFHWGVERNMPALIAHKAYRTSGVSSGLRSFSIFIPITAFD
jgi:hypothetical protein